MDSPLSVVGLGDDNINIIAYFVIFGNEFYRLAFSGTVCYNKANKNALYSMRAQTKSPEWLLRGFLFGLAVIVSFLSSHLQI